MEYHYGYEKLKDKLEGAGFNVAYSKPINIVDNDKDATKQNEVLGYIYAKSGV